MKWSETDEMERDLKKLKKLKKLKIEKNKN
jgi:hypothetical protein